jgi:hypothetical protein
MFSKLNSCERLAITPDSQFSGQFEDVSQYVTIDINGAIFDFSTNEPTALPANASIQLNWYQKVGYPLDGDADIIQQNIFLPTKEVTSSYFNKQVVVSGKWLKISFIPTGTVTYRLSMSTLYKTVQRNLFTISDQNGLTVSSLQTGSTNALFACPVDFSGFPIATSVSNSVKNNAMNITLTDQNSLPVSTNTSTSRVSIASTTVDSQNIPQAAVTQTEAPSPGFPNGRFSVWLRFLSTTAPTSLQSTMIIAENSFRIPLSQAVFTDGDTVHFLMLTSNTVPTTVANLSPKNYFTSTDNNGYLHTTGKVKILRTDTTHVTFQLLVDSNVGDWFTTTEGITLQNPVNLPNFCTFLGQTGFGYRYSLNLSYTTPTRVPTVANYYEVIKTGYPVPENSPYKYLHPGIYPLDLRFFLGSRGRVWNSENTFISMFELASQSSTNAQLLMSPRNNNGNFLSTNNSPGTITLNNIRSNINLSIVVCSALTDGFNSDALLQSILRAYAGYTEETQLVSKLNSMVTNNFNSRLGNYYVSCSVWNSNEETVVYDTGRSTTSTGVPLTVSNTRSGSNRPWLIVSKAYESNFNNTPIKFADTILIILTKGNATAGFADLDWSSKEDVIKNYGKIVSKRFLVLAPEPEADTNVTALDNAGFNNLVDIAGGIDNVIFYSEATLMEDFFISIVADRILKLSVNTENSVKCINRNSQGVAQGSVLLQGSNNVALNYTLADSAGKTIHTTSTYTTGTINALSTSLMCNAVPVKTSNPLPILIMPPLGTHFDISVGLSPISPGLTNNKVKLNTLYLTNLTNSTMWVKLYDVSVGKVNNSNYATLSSSVVLNLAVNASSYRDITISYPIQFNNGVYLSASSTSSYSVGSFPTSTSVTNYVIVNGSYT